MTKTRNNNQAQHAYAAAHAECFMLLERLKGYIEDAPAPDDKTHWGQVATLSEIASKLREIAEFAGA